MFTLRRLVFLAILVVVAVAPPLLAQGLPLTMSKSFNPSTVSVGGTATTTMTVTITNPNGFTVSGISFSDTYPTGLVPDQVGAYTCNAGSAVFNGSGWALNNVTLGAGASCSVPILMHATIAGQITNTTSQVTGVGVPPGGPASAVLNATIPTPTLSEWMLIAFAITIAAVAAMRMRAG
ncbi:MAG TPA: IPTL-CTERM sorting domain-containing protein [Thermoanaerobaculia bacterium]|nr:IPTL-CTERM sorting domain-containing protein [Thermoanaerobaculia bacterium]